MTSKRIIIALRCGRLANRLTLFANFIGFAAEYQYRVINFSFHSYAELFETTRRDIYCQFPPSARISWLDVIPGVARVLRQTRILYHGVHAASRLRLPRALAARVVTLREAPGQEVTLLESAEVANQIRLASTVFIDGWNFRAPDCVARHAEKIRQFFRPAAEHIREPKRLVETLRQKGEVVVGVHVRHGDYRNWRGGKYFFPASRYAEWMREFAEQFSPARVCFLVCSDEPRSSEEFRGLNVVTGSRAPVEDLYALSRCDYIFGPVSSFTQWASFYGAVPLLNLRGLQESLSREKFRVSCLSEIPR